MTVDEILEALRAIVDGAKTEDGSERPLSDEEAERYESLETQLATARRTQQIRARQAAYETPVRDRALESVVYTGTARQDDTLERAFDSYLRTGQANQDLVELRGQTVGTPSEGGFTVPETFRQKLVDRQVAFGGIANEVEVITTAGGEDMRWPTLDDVTNSAVIASEETAPASGGADLVFGETTLGAFRYVAPGASQLPLRVSLELLSDSNFDIQALVTRKLGERIAREQADHWINGVGTTEPLGLSGGTSNETVFSGSAPTFAELVTAVHDVDPAYRGNAVWTFNDSTLAVIRSIEDQNGRPLWLPQQTSGMTETPGGVLLGHRVVIDQAWDDFTDNSANVWGAFGDMNESYVIRRVQEVTLIVDPYTRINEGQVQYVLWARGDGTIQNPNSYTRLGNGS